MVLLARGSVTVTAVNDGVPEKLYRAWSNNANGSGYSTTDSSGKYLGTYVGLSEPTLASQYKWTLIKGETGEPGQPGVSAYLHTAWANSANGQTGFSTSVSTDKLYIGTYSSSSSTPSQAYTSYKWVRVKGLDAKFYSVIVDKSFLNRNGLSSTATEKIAINSYVYEGNSAGVAAPGFFIIKEQIKQTTAGVTTYVFQEKHRSTTAVSQLNYTVSANAVTVKIEFYLTNQFNNLFAVRDIGVLMDASTDIEARVPIAQLIENINNHPSTTRISGAKLRFTNDVTFDKSFHTKLFAETGFIENLSTYEFSADNIKTGTLEADHIKGGTLDFDLFHAKHFSADSLTSGTIDADIININNLSASRIKTGNLDVSSGLKITSGNHQIMSIDPETLNLEFNVNQMSIGGVKLISEDDQPQMEQNIATELEGKIKPYLHIAYANNATGTSGFSISDSLNKLYIGTYTNYTSTHSTDPSKYKWALIKGEKGTTGVGLQSITEWYLATPLKEGVTRTTSGWKDSVQTLSSVNNYLWNYEQVNYDNGTKQYTEPTIIGTFGEQGISVKGVTEYYLASPLSEGITKNTPGWTTDIQPLTPENKYLWNKEIVHYSDDAAFLDKTEILSGKEIFTDKADEEAVVHVEVDGKSYQSETGDNLSVNGNFANDLDNWYVNGAASIDNIDGMKVIKLQGTNQGFYQYPSEGVLGYYEISFKAKSVGASSAIKYGFLNKGNGASTGQSITGNWQTYSYRTDIEIGPVKELYHFYATANTNEGVYITDITVKPIGPTPHNPIEIHSLNDFDMVSSVGRENLLLSDNFNKTNYSNYQWDFLNLNDNDNLPLHYNSFIQHYYEQGEYTLSFEMKYAENYTTSTANIRLSKKTLSSPSFVSIAYVGSNFNDKWKKVTYTFSLDAASLIGLQLYSRTNKDIFVRNLKLERGSTPTEWSPSSADILELDSNPLIDRINLLLDEPLRAVDDVKDRLFRDNDGLWKVERKIGKRLFNGLEPFIQSGPHYYIPTPNSRVVRSHIISTHFSYNNTTAAKKGTVSWGGSPNSNGNMFFGDEWGSLDNFKLWVQQQHAKGTPLAVQYILENYITEFLSQSLQSKLNNLRTFKDSNHIYTVLPDKSNILSENLKPTLDATFKSKAWAGNFAGYPSIIGVYGDSAKLLYLSTSSDSMTFNSDGSANPASQTITFTGNLQNVLGNVIFTAIAYNGTTVVSTISLSGVGNTRTLTQAQFPASADRIQVKATLGNLEDTVTIVKLKNGADAIVGYLTNESVTLSANNAGTVSSFSSASGTFKVFEGTIDKTSSAASTFRVKTQTGAVATINSSSGVYSVSSMSSDSANIVFEATYKNIKIDQTLSLSKSKEGIKGIPGPQGVSITKVDVQYYLSTSNDSLVGGGWSTTAPAWIDGRFMWSKTVTTYTSGSPTESKPVCITGAKGSTGGTGNPGATGRGVSSIVEQFYLSNSKDTQTGGSWSTTMPTWSPGKYVWTRSLITYTTGAPATSTTEPLVSSEWEAINELEIGGRNLLLNSHFLKENENNGWNSVYGGHVVSNSISTKTFVSTGSSTRIQKDFILNEIGTFTFSIYAKISQDIEWRSFEGLQNVFVRQEFKEDFHVYSVTFTNGIAGNKIIRGYLPNAPIGSQVLIDWEKLEKGNKPTDWAPAPEDVQKEIDDVSDVTNTLKNFTNTAFVDGIIERAEAQAIKEHLNTLKKENNDLLNQYSTLYSNVNLVDPAKNSLLTARNNYATSYTSLVSVINTAISGDKTTAAQKTAVDNGFVSYTNSLQAFTQKLSEAQTAIGTKVSTDAVNSIEIGGRNLLPNSDFNNKINSDIITPWSNSNISSDVPSDYNQRFVLAMNSNTAIGSTVGMQVGVGSGRFKVVQGQDYTLSFIGISSNSVKTDYDYLHIMRPGSASNHNIGTLLTKKEKIGTAYTDFDIYKYQYNFTGAWNEDSAYLLIATRTTIVDAYQWIRVAQIQIEKGNKATDWSPAPEDIAASIKNAQDKANAASQEAIAAQADATIGKNMADNLSNDSIITQVEKLELKREWDAIVKEKPSITIQATDYALQGSTEATAYNTAYNSLNGSIPTLLSKMNETSPVNRTTFNTNFANYYDKRQLLLNRIAKKAKELADSAQSSVDNLEVGGVNLLQGTSDEWTTLNMGTAHYTNIDFKDTILEVGKTYTFSIIVEKVSADTVPINLHIGTGTTTYQKDIIGWRKSSIPFGEKVSLTYTVTADDIGTFGGIFTYRLRNETRPTVIRYKMEMLEAGNIATNWRVSPEDIQAAYTAVAEAKAEAERIKAEVYADDKVTAEEQARIDDVEAKLAAAKQHAENISKVQNMGGANKKFINVGHITSRANSQKGYLVIKTPFTSSYMVKMKISGYNYTQGKTDIDLNVGFYAYTGSNILQYSYMSNGDYPYSKVQLARDTNDRVVIIAGAESDSYSYPAITIDEALVSFSTAPDSFKDGFSIEITRDISMYSIKVANVPGGDTKLSISAAQTAANNAATAASNAQSTANAASNSASTANSLLADIASDSVLTPGEKKSTKKEWDIIVGEKPKIDASADTYSITTQKTAYNNAYNALNTYLTGSGGLLVNLNAKSAIAGDTFRNNFKNYYNARQDLLNAIADSAKSLVDGIEIGGTNLVSGSPTDWVTQSMGAGTYTATLTSRIKISDLGLKAGDTITLSMEVQAGPHGAKARLEFYKDESNRNQVFGNLIRSDSGLTYVTAVIPPDRPMIIVRVSPDVTPVVTAHTLKYRRFKVEKGNKATSWSPSLEDTQLEIDKSTYNPVRYIRDWANGSTANTSNHWYEIQAIDTLGNNIALGKTVRSNASTSFFPVVTDGNTAGTYATGSGNMKAYMEVDLGSVYYNISEIKVWRYHNDGRTYYDTKTEVSKDGNNWYPIFDSKIEDEYSETSAGRTYPNTQAKSEGLLSAYHTTERLESATSKVVINGGNITAGRIQDSLKRNNLNLDNGTFEFANGNIKYDGTKLTIKSGVEFAALPDDTQTKINAGAAAEANAKKYVDNNTGNLVNNPAATGNHTGWTGSGLSSLNQTFEGVSTRVLRTATSDNVQYYSSYFKVDPSKAYEVSAWFKKSVANSSGYYFGLNGVDTSGSSVGFVQTTQAGGISNANNTNFYFISGTAPTDWIKVVGYIMPVGTNASDLKGMGTSLNAIMKQNIDRIRVRFLNWNNGGTTRELWVANPKVVEVDPNAIITAAQAKTLTDTWVEPGTTQINGNNILTGTLSAGKITTGTLSANNGTSTLNMSTGDMIMNGNFNLGSGALQWNKTSKTLSIKANSLKIGSYDAASKNDVEQAVDGIEIGGRNLVVLRDISNNTYISTNGTTAVATGHATTAYIEVLPNQDYVWSASNINQLRVAYYNSSKAYISTDFRGGDQGSVVRFKTSSNAAFIRVSAQSPSLNTWKIEKGSHATDWTPSTDDVYQYVDDVEIGGTQLLDGTSNQYTYLNLGQWYTTIVGGDTKPFADYGLSIGDTITYRVYIKSTSGNGGIARLTIFEANGGYTTRIGSAIENGAEGYSTVTYTIESDRTRLSVGIQNSVNTGVSTSAINYKEPKLEKGVKATAWSMSQNDYQMIVDSVEVGGDNLLRIGEWASYPSYNTIPVVSHNGRRITFTKNNHNSIAISNARLPYGPNIYYVISGYAKIDDQPVTNATWGSYRSASTYQGSTTYFNVRDSDGYFVIVQNWTNSSQWLFHASNLMPSLNGTITIDDFMVQAGNKPSGWKLNPEDERIGGENLLYNSDFSKTAGGAAFTVGGIRYSTYPARWGGYNGGVNSATTNYHMHLDDNTFGYNVVEFNESNGTRHWKGGNISLDGLVKSPGFYTVSVDLYATGSETRLFGGFYYYKKGGTTMSFHAGQYSISPNVINNWKRYSVLHELPDDVDLNQNIRFYMYGYGFGTNSILYVRKIQLQEGTIASSWSLSTEDVEEMISLKADQSGTSTIIQSMQAALDIALQEKTAAALQNELSEFIKNYNKKQEAEAKEKVASEKRIKDIEGREVLTDTYYGDMVGVKTFIDRTFFEGEEGLMIKNGKEGTHILINDEEISFFSDGTKTAYISQNKLSISDGTFIENLQIGDISASNETSRSHLTFRYTPQK